MSNLHYLCITPDLEKEGVSVVLHTEKTVTGAGCKIFDAEGKCVTETNVSPENNSFSYQLKILCCG